MPALKRKLSRKRDQRVVLIKNLATSLVLDEQLTTTLPKAKTLLPYMERLITKARKGDLHNRRQVIAGLLRDDAAAKLVDLIAPQLKRDSGFIRLKKTGLRRRGDGSELATLSFVDELKQSEEAKKKAAEKAKPAKTGAGAEKAKTEPAKPKFDNTAKLKAPAGSKAAQTKHLPQKKG